VQPNRSIPQATVVRVPVLVYPDVRAAVDGLIEAFGFAERVWIGKGYRFSETIADVAPEEWGGSSIAAGSR
jgi:hypothetical protein